MSALFGFTGTPDQQSLRAMAEALRHRGTKQLLFSNHIATLCHARAPQDPALELDCAGLTRCGDTVLALAGFVTNAAAWLKAAPAEPGPPETALHRALLNAYRRDGLDVLTGLRGAFVLALLDGKTLHLARDGAGARSLYYGTHQQRTFFAIEPKGIWSLPGFSRRIRPEAVARYLSFSFLPGSGTMLENLFEVLPGQVLTFHEGTMRQRQFFRFESEPESASETDWPETFRNGLKTAIAERLAPGQPPGAFLSGGIDSSVVVYELSKMAPGRVRTFACHFGKEYPNELEYARAVARLCNTDHEEIQINPRFFLPQLRKIIWNLDDPIGDPVAMPNYMMAARVGKEMNTVFNGEGGDPCFGGPKNISMMLHHWYGGINRGPNFLERNYLAAYRRCYDELPQLLTPEWQALYDTRRDLEGVLTPYFQNTETRGLLRKLTTINIRLKGAHLILPKVERMLAAHGLTPLSPLFDERIIRMSFQMPSSLIHNQGIEKVILKQAYGACLPEEIIRRPKSGMRVPVHFWFRGELKRYAHKILSPRSLKRAGIFQPERVKQLLKYDIEEGRGRYGIRLWMLITFEIWRRMVIEGEAT